MLLAGIALNADADESSTRIKVGSINGDDVHVVLDKTTMHGTPSWDATGDSAIPLTSSAAVAVAVTHLGKALLRKPFGGFTASKVSLRRYSEKKFYYIVCLEPDFQPTGLHREVNVVVTLDGVAVPFQKLE